MADSMSPDVILPGMADAIPDNKDQRALDVSTAQEVIGLFSHTCMIAYGFRLLSCGGLEKKETTDQTMAPRLPPNWNRSKLNHGPDDASYSFLYAHGAGDTTYRIKIDKMGRNVEIRGVNSTDEDNIIRLEITIKDHVDPSSFPITTSADDGAENRASAESLKGIFIQLDALIHLFKTNMIEKLLGGSNHESDPGALEAQRVRDLREAQHQFGTPSQIEQEPARPNAFDNPIADHFNVPRPAVPSGDFPPPGFDDELDLQRPPRGSGLAIPETRSPFSIGHDDLNPPGLGRNDPLRESFTGGGLGGFGGGMHPTFDPRAGRGMGGRGYGNAPPGARYDPVGPGDEPPFGMGMGDPGNPFGRGGNPPGPYGGAGFGGSGGFGGGGFM